MLVRWVHYKNNSVSAHELNIGGGYLSQSAPIVFLGNRNEIEKVIVQWSDGSENKVDINKLAVNFDAFN